MHTLRDHFALVLRHCRRDVQRQPVRLGKVKRHEIHVSVHEGRDEAAPPGQPVEFGDDQDCVVPPAGGQGGSELRALVLLAALDLAELLGQPAALSSDVGVDRRPMCVDPQASLALALRADADVAHERLTMRVLHDPIHRAAVSNVGLRM